MVGVLLLLSQESHPAILLTSPWDNFMWSHLINPRHSWTISLLMIPWLFPALTSCQSTSLIYPMTCSSSRHVNVTHTTLKFPQKVVSPSMFTSWKKNPEVFLYSSLSLMPTPMFRGILLSQLGEWGANVLEWPGMLLNIWHFTGQPQRQTVIWPRCCYFWVEKHCPNQVVHLLSTASLFHFLPNTYHHPKVPCFLVYSLFPTLVTMNSLRAGLLSVCFLASGKCLDSLSVSLSICISLFIFMYVYIYCICTYVYVYGVKWMNQILNECPLRLVLYPTSVHSFIQWVSKYLLGISIWQGSVLYWVL